MRILLFLHLILVFSSSALSSPVKNIASPINSKSGGHLTILRSKGSAPAELGPRTASGRAGLNNFKDIIYTVPLTVGGTVIRSVLDTGSSDCWVISDRCKTCKTAAEVPKYPTPNANLSGIALELVYGDFSSKTIATGLIGSDTVEVAGIAMANQYFAAMDFTNVTFTGTGAGGIFGLGFPVNSAIWVRLARELIHQGTRLPNLNSPVVLDLYLHFAPFLPRLLASNGLALPMFSITLQRETVDDTGSEAGTLSIGQLPPGISNDSMMWTPLRSYRTFDPASDDTDAIAESFPSAWEIFIENVGFDGSTLFVSNIAPAQGKVSALIDSGSSLIRGPEDVVTAIWSQLGAGTDGTFSCSVPHTLSFQIGGKEFTVDPRDFVRTVPANSSGEARCRSTLAIQDPPNQNARHSWVLGSPFLKGVASAFYYGNLIRPSMDPPRVGLFSTVPPNASELYNKTFGTPTSGSPPKKSFQSATSAGPKELVMTTLNEQKTLDVYSMGGRFVTSLVTDSWWQVVICFWVVVFFVVVHSQRPL